MGYFNEYLRTTGDIGHNSPYSLLFLAQFLIGQTT